MRVKFTDKEQMDLVEAQALADSAEDNGYELTKLLLFSGDYRISGALVNQDSPASGVVKADPGIFVKAGGKYYSMGTTATANILTGTESQSLNIWGTGQASDPVLPRIDIICVSWQQVEGGATVKNFINDSVDPPVEYTQVVTTRKYGTPLFSVLHGTPSATPSEPSIPSGFMKLASVLVPANATTILTSYITNNLNINLKSLEALQLGSQAQSAFSDRLHSDGVYPSYLNELQVVQTSPLTMAVSVSTGTALKGGTTASVTTATTVPIDVASWVRNNDEVVDFATGDTRTLLTNGTPPHKIRPGTYVIEPVGGGTAYTDTIDYTINLAAGTITRLPGGSIPPGNSVWASYDYYLPRIDIVVINMGNSTPVAVAGTPAQTPVAPSTPANTLLLSWVTVDEGIATVSNSNITDKRVFLPTMDEVVVGRDGYASLNARFVADEAATALVSSNLSTHSGSNITPSNTVHGIRQGSGNGFDADKVDGIQATDLLARANHTGTQAPATISPQGSGSTLDADMVDGYHVSATPLASSLVPLDGTAKFPPAVIPNLVGNSIKDNLIVQSDGTSPNSKLNITADQLSVQGLVVSAVSVSADMAVSGAGGLDTGTEAVNTWYRVFVITNAGGTLVNGLLSTSATPTMPPGYVYYRRVGWARNNASSDFIHSYKTANRVKFLDPSITAIYLGASANGVGFSSLIPPTSRVGEIAFWGQDSFAGGFRPSLSLRLPGQTNWYTLGFGFAFSNFGGFSYGNNGLSAWGEVLFSPTQTIDISMSSGGGTFQVVGYLDD